MLRLGRAELVEPPEHPEVLATCQVLVHGRVLAGEADEPAYGLRVARDIEAGDRRPSCVCSQERCEDADRRRLAGTVRAEEAEHCSLVHLEVDAVERAHLGLARAVDLDETLGFDDGHRGTLAVRPSPVPTLGG